MATGAHIYARLATEKLNAKSRGIDLKSPQDIVRLMNQESAAAVRAVGRESANIARAAEELRRRLENGGRALLVGAGTSGRLGVLEAAECPPTFNTPPSLLRAAMAGGKNAVFASKEGAEDDARAGEAAASGLGPKDILIAVAASGVTPFSRAALQAARRARCRTVLVTSNRLAAARAADIVISPRVGPEIVAGSTRLKSGTAAKLVLNALTTTAMIRLGKVYDGWMVDLKPASRKLRLRALRLVQLLGKTSPARAQALFEDSGRNVKLAVLRARLNLGRVPARRLLRENRGNLRRALKQFPLSAPSATAGPGRT
ncbi:MAG TPA: N-acetylmuramic acid 6-phosphate etherase [Elusimicrobiota bacterium]|nr:N-acetylmuramic acid 6-phosphate etherase [Elusimicrobiota bacterium]